MRIGVAEYLDFKIRFIGILGLVAMMAACESSSSDTGTAPAEAPAAAGPILLEVVSFNELNRKSFADICDPEIEVRMPQYEMAFKMQASVPELTELSGEPESVYQLYGDDSKKRGTFANSALMARRLMERGVRFVQIFHRGWDQHGHLPRDLASQCKDVDQGCYGLIQGLKQRGMLEDTLVICGGEFGRTVYC